jgi:hypothetical protein
MLPICEVPCGSGSIPTRSPRIHSSPPVTRRGDENQRVEFLQLAGGIMLPDHAPYVIAGHFRDGKLMGDPDAAESLLNYRR